MHNQNNAWFTALLHAGGMTAQQAATDTANASLDDIMAKATARCFLGGDPHLVAVERNNGNFTSAEKQIGGDETTFTSINGARGQWRVWPGPIDPRVAATRGDAQYLFPIYRGLNPATKGVVSFTGTIGMSGVLRGRMSIYSTGSIIILDDMRYATDPSAANDQPGAKCPDMLGVIATNNITVADNAILGPQFLSPTGPNFWKNFDDTKDVYIHGISMALNTSFGVEKYDQGPTNANGCEASQSGRDCLYVYGGLIQESRGAVGLVGGSGYVKRYTYDRCAISNPPPYFPTTGRFLDNRYYEIDPVRFDVATLFAGIQPKP